MDAFQALAHLPFVAESTLDIADGDVDGFYDEGGEPVECDHRHYADGATVGEAGWGRASGRYIPTDRIGGGRRVSRN